MKITIREILGKFEKRMIDLFVQNRPYNEEYFNKIEIQIRKIIKQEEAKKENKMCWKYEKEYRTCFDYIGEEIGDSGGEPILFFLKNYYNIKVVDKWNFTDLLFKLLTKCHEKGYIKPEEDEKNEKNSSNWL